MIDLVGECDVGFERMKADCDRVDVIFLQKHLEGKGELESED